MRIITLFREYKVPEEIDIRIKQHMRGVLSLYNLENQIDIEGFYMFLAFDGLNKKLDLLMLEIMRHFG